jgi:hypothetical protein
LPAFVASAPSSPSDAEAKPQGHDDEAAPETREGGEETP